MSSVLGNNRMHELALRMESYAMPLPTDLVARLAAGQPQYADFRTVRRLERQLAGPAQATLAGRVAVMLNGYSRAPDAADKRGKHELVKALRMEIGPIISGQWTMAGFEGMIRSV